MYCGSNYGSKYLLDAIGEAIRMSKKRIVYYSPMQCRVCPQLITSDVFDAGPPSPAASYDGCYFKCKCGVAYSNAASEKNRTLVHKKLEDNVPSAVHNDLRAVLAQALNVRNRPPKLERFAFETSEDAITWTVFRFLQQHGDICSALGLVASTTRQVLYWGTEWPLVSVSPIRSELEHLLTNQLDENPNSHSEPDLLVVTHAQVAIVEVKYRSRNAVQTGHGRFRKYVNYDPLLFAYPSAVPQAGHYELTRNCVIVHELARRLGLQPLLINLGPDRIEASADAFASSLSPSTKNAFRFLSWPDLIQKLPPSLPTWMDEYIRSRRLG